MPVRIARDRTATSFLAGTRVNRERKTLNSLEPFKLRCIDHVVSCLSLAQLIVLC